MDVPVTCRGVGFPDIGVTDSCEPSVGAGNQNPGPVEEQQVF